MGPRSQLRPRAPVGSSTQRAGALSSSFALDMAQCSCFTKISRHHVCPVTAAQRLGWGGNPAAYQCTVQGPAFPDCCPKAAGHGMGGLVLEQEKEGGPFPPALTNDLIPPFGMSGHWLRMMLRAPHETTLTLSLFRTQPRTTGKRRSFGLIKKTLFQHCL